MNQHDPAGDSPDGVAGASTDSVSAAVSIGAENESGADGSQPEPSEETPQLMGEDAEAGTVEVGSVEVAPEEVGAGSGPDDLAAEDGDADDADAESAGAEQNAPASASSEEVVERSAAAVNRSRPDAEPDDVPEAPEPPITMEWYVLKVQSNRERTIRDSLLRRIKRDSLERYFGEIVIPTEKRIETKAGKKRVMEHKLYPGYIMINMCLNDETWYLVRDTGGVGDFTGAAGKPLPMLPSEVKSMLAIQDKPDDQPAPVKINFATGDTVKIKEGPFESFEGSINSIDEANGKVSVLIEIFGRSTPVDLEYWQVERV